MKTRNMPRVIPALVLAMLFGAVGQAQAALITVDFDALDASSGSVSGAPLDTYLAGFGISISGASHPAAVGVYDERNVYGGGVVGVPSSYNFLTIEPGGAPPVWFTMDFALPLNSFSFTFPAILVPSAVPQWSATAFDSGGGSLGSVFSPLKGGTFPSLSYTLTGPGIASVRFDANGYNFAAWSGPLIDDVQIDPVPEPSTLSIWSLLGALGIAVGWWRQRRKAA